MGKVTLKNGVEEKLNVLFIYGIFVFIEIGPRRSD